MGTQQLPDSNPDPPAGEPVVDQPRVGGVTWAMLACFLLPPALVTLIGNNWVVIPHQTLWVILLGVPIPLILLTLPRRYAIDPQHLTITGFIYRVRIPRQDILSITPIGTLRALFHPGSMYCSDPARALRITRRTRRELIISPAEPGPFRSLATAQDHSSKGGEP